MRLECLIWVRSSHNAEHALKAADLLIQGGGFGIVVMDLGDTPLATARRISLTSWFRLRRAVEHTPTVLVTVSRQANAKTCASLILECKRERVAWSGTPGKVRELSFPMELGTPSYLLRGICVRVTSKNRSKLCSPVFTALAI